MGTIFTDINNFLNQEQSIEVLSVLVLLMALIWLLTGGFSFLRKKPGRYSDKTDEEENEGK